MDEHDNMLPFPGDDVVGPGFIPVNTPTKVTRRTSISLPIYPDNPISPTIKCEQVLSGHDADITIKVEGEPKTTDEYQYILSIIKSII